MIQLSLMSKENLKSADEKVPKSTTPVMVERSSKQISPEILGWSIAILASAWTEWVFASKTYNPKYQNDPEYADKADRQAAVQNVKLALPYVYCSIIDSMNKGRKIGICKETNYEPNPDIDLANLELRKDCRETGTMDSH
jgi:hypothetical protein